MGVNIFNRDYPISIIFKLKFDIIKAIFKPRRVLNIIKIWLYNITKKRSLLSMPFSVMIEPTSRCNLNCVMCGKRQMKIGGIKRKDGDMKFGLFKKIIDEIRDYVCVVFLWNYGEPFLNRNTIEMIKYAKSKDIFLAVSTNGTKIDDKIAKKIVRSGLPYLIVSLDGPNKEIYEKYRKGGNFNSVIEGINSIVKYKKIMKSYTPIIDLQFLVMKENENCIDEMNKLSRVLKVDLITFKKCQIGIKSLKDKILPKNKKFLFKSYKESIRKKGVCYKPFSHSVINWNGDVFPCCDNLFPEYNMGNVFNRSFKNIWYGGKYNKFRKKHIENLDSIHMCKICPNKTTFEKTHLLK